jgi:hypothetical protein
MERTVERIQEEYERVRQLYRVRYEVMQQMLADSKAILESTKFKAKEQET